MTTPRPPPRRWCLFPSDVGVWWIIKKINEWLYRDEETEKESHDVDFKPPADTTITPKSEDEDEEEEEDDDDQGGEEMDGQSEDEEDNPSEDEDQNDA